MLSLAAGCIYEFASSSGWLQDISSGKRQRQHDGTKLITYSGPVTDRFDMSLHCVFKTASLRFRATLDNSRLPLVGGTRRWKKKNAIFLRETRTFTGNFVVSRRY